MTTAQWLTYFSIGLIGSAVIIALAIGIGCAIVYLSHEIRFRAYVRRGAEDMRRQSKGRL